MQPTDDDEMKILTKKRIRMNCRQVFILNVTKKLRRHIVSRGSLDSWITQA